MQAFEQEKNVAEEAMPEDVTAREEQAAEAPVEKTPEWLPPQAHVRPNVKEMKVHAKADASPFLTPGTPECGALCGVLGVVIAALLLWIGLWKTLFVAIMCAAGVFVGAVKDKSQWMKDLINRLFPPKN